jgi:hypothetical protein
MIANQDDACRVPDKTEMVVCESLEWVLTDVSNA